MLPSLTKVGNTALKKHKGFRIASISESISWGFYFKEFVTLRFMIKGCSCCFMSPYLSMQSFCTCNVFVVEHFRLVVYIFTHLENVQKDMPTNTQLERKILSKNEGFVIILVKLFFFHICYHSWKPITEVTYFGATGIFRSTHHELMWRKKCGIIGESFFLIVHFLRKKTYSAQNINSTVHNVKMAQFWTIIV